MPDARFEDLLDFPCAHVLRVVIDDRDGVHTECAAAVTGLTGRGARVLGRRPSREGRYVALSVEVEVDSADELRAVYARLGELVGVRMVL